MQAMKKTRNY